MTIELVQLKGKNQLSAMVRLRYVKNKMALDLQGPVP